MALQLLMGCDMEEGRSPLPQTGAISDVVHSLVALAASQFSGLLATGIFKHLLRRKRYWT